MRAFVTGSTGLLGSNLVAALIAEGWSVRALARDAGKAAAQLGQHARLEVVTGDLERIDALGPHLAGVDVVFHTAAYFREYFGEGEHEGRLQALNVDATLTLARLARDAGVRRFVHTSSSGTLRPKPDGSPGDEDDIEPEAGLTNRYFASKVRCDAALAELSAGIGLDVVTVLPGWMFGPGDAAPTSAGKLVRDALAGRLPPMSMPGGTPVADARDVAAAMVRMATEARPGERFLVAGHSATLTEVIAGVAEAAGRPAPRGTLPYPLAFAVAWMFEGMARLTGGTPVITRTELQTLNSGHVLSSARAIERLGVTFRPLQQTLADSVAWQRVHAPAR